MPLLRAIRPNIDGSGVQVAPGALGIKLIMKDAAGTGEGERGGTTMSCSPAKRPSNPSGTRTGGAGSGIETGETGGRGGATAKEGAHQGEGLEGGSGNKSGGAEGPGAFGTSGHGEGRRGEAAGVSTSVGVKNEGGVGERGLRATGDATEILRTGDLLRERGRRRQEGLPGSVLPDGGDEGGRGEECTEAADIGGADESCQR